ncbi:MULTISPECIES: calcium-binding protein [unclassified Microbulbifer]|uniref:calcium-binding protein n=1 Tax=unclassified Microbulbifer TaxID=2619833 RepID=UPI0027E591ED|nr:MULTISPECIES: calcium-binding protein [unclassified Microbulbifer]
MVIGLETNGTVQATNVGETSNGNDLLIAVDENGQTLNGGAGSDVLIGASGVDTLNGGEEGDVLVGKGGGDHLYGQDGFDILGGGAGADTLNGGKDADLLLGGTGGDTYEFNSGDGVDTVKDSSTGNTLQLDGSAIPELTGVSASNMIYKSEEGDIRLIKTDDGFVVIYGDASQTVSAIQVSGLEDDFGLTLSDYQEEDTTQPAMDPNSFEVGDSNLGTPEEEDWLDFDQESRSPDFNAQPIFFDASLISSDNPDFPEDPGVHTWNFDGGEANDTLIADGDYFNPRLFGLDGEDTIVIGASDWAWATGGEGGDYIRHTGGKGFLFGDFHLPVDLPEEYREYDGEGEDTLISESTAFKSLDGGGGKDILIAGAGGEGWLMGGSGSDIIQGGDGKEFIFGDGRATLEQEGSRVSLTLRIQDIFASGLEYDDIIDAGDGDNVVFGGAGNDTITAGDGDDKIWGDVGSAQFHGSNLLPEDIPLDMHGDDVIYAGGGKNQIVGGGGHDVILGGGDVDWIWGDDPTHEDLEGGNDYLNGGAGNDYIQAGGGNDVLIGGAGSDILRGGDGDDTYIFNPGDGLDYIVDSDGDNRIVINGASLQNARLYQYGDISFGADLNLSIAYGEGDMIDLPESTLSSSTVILGGAAYDFFDLWSAYTQQWLRRSEAILDAITGGSGDSPESAPGTQVSTALNASISPMEAAATESTATLTDWYGGQLVAIDASTAGIDSQDPSTWLQNGAVSLTGILTFYTDAEGTIMAGVPDGEGGYLAPAGAIQEYRLLPDGSLFSREPDFARGEAPALGQDVEPPTGAEGDTSGINVDDEIIDGTSGDDTIDGGEGMDLIRGGDGSDLIDGGVGKDILLGGAGNDTLHGGDGDDFLYGNEGADQLQGGAGNDYLDGGDGDDILQGGNGNDLLKGGSGNDTLSGGAGSDQYFFGLGDGQDTIDNSGDTGTSTVAFAEEISPHDVKVTRSGDHLLLTVDDGGDSVTITGYFTQDATTESAVDKITFNNGRTVWTIDDVKALALIGDDADNTLRGYNNSDDLLMGLEGNDLLIGGAGEDTLEGGTGDDTLQGGSGDDTYIVDLAEGHDRIVDLAGQNNVLQLGSDVQIEDVKAIREGNDLLLSLEGGASSVTIANYFGAAGETVSSINFDDGTAWDLAQVKQLVLTGTDAADTITGYDSDDTLVGKGGNDLLTGNGGSDTYLFSAGDGQDLIVTGETDTATTETILFDESVSEELVSVRRNGNDVILDYGDGNAVTVRDFFVAEGATTSAIDRVVFSSGAVWTTEDLKAKVLIGDVQGNTIEAYSSDDLLIGNGGNDTLIGGAGDDTYRFSVGDGADLIDDQAGIQDRIEFTDVNPADLLLRRDGEDLLITNTVSGDTVRVQEQFSTIPGEVSASAIDSIVFADATVWDYEQIKQQALAGTGNADEIHGHADADTVHAGAGNDTVYGALGADTLFGEDGADTLYGEEGDDEIHGGAGNDYLAGGSGYNHLYGDAGDDTLVGNGLLDGGEGNDVLSGEGNSMLIGGAGNDTLSGSWGNDVYRFTAGDGLDLINDGGGDQDQLQFTDVNPGDVLLRRDGNDLLITNTLSGDSIRVANQFSTQAGVINAAGIDSIVFADTTVWNYEEIKQQALAGTEGNDEIYGHADADNITAGAGDDTVYGRAGNDTIDGGLGQDSLYGESGDDEIHGGDGADTILGGAGNDRLYGDEGDDVIEDYSGENLIRGGIGDDQLTGNGSLYGDEGADTLTGSGLLDGGAGNDLITGEGSDTLVGGSGGDVISAFSQFFTQNSNTLEGGTGNDTLFGSFGNDEYRFNLGDGHDTLTERREGEDYSNVDPSSDTLVFGAGISQADLQFERHGNDLFILHSNGTDSIRITDWYSGGTDHFKINTIQFAGGSSLALSEIEDLAVTYGTAGDDTLLGYRSLDDRIRAGDGNDQVWGRDGNDTLYGEGGDDYLDGDAGDDLIEGGAGADTLIGRAGSDTLIGGIGDDSYVYTAGSGSDLIINGDGGYDGLFFLDGIDRERLSFERDGDDLLVLVDEDPTQSVRVQDHFLGGDHAIDFVQPDGGFLLDTEEINQIIAGGGSDYDAVIEGTASSEQLVGTSGRDLIQGLAGDDTLFGMAGDDELQGGADNDYLSGGNGSGSGSGNDTLLGGDGNDILNGEDGDDWLAGGLGDDRYYYTANGGVDTIDNTGGGFDGIFTLDGVGRDRLSFHQDGDDLVILVDSDLGQQIRVTGHFLGGEQAISYVQPDDGGASIMATDIPGLLQALPDGDGDSGGDPGEGGEPPVPETGGDDVVNGTAGDDILLGGEGSDTLHGDSGNDTLIGGSGDDVYLYSGGQDTIDSRGGGTDTLRFIGGITFSEVASYLTKSGDHLLLRVNGGPDQVTLTNFFLGGEHLVENIEFETGGSLTAQQIFDAFGLPMQDPQPAFDSTVEGTTGDDSGLSGSAGRDLIRGGNGNDLLQGIAGDDRLEGGNGADTLEGGEGADVLSGGRGDDIYIFRPGDGQDVIDNTGGGHDELRFDGIDFNQISSGLTKSGNDLVLNVSGGSDSVTLKNWFLGGDYVVDTISFTSGGSITSEQIFGAFGLSNPDPAGSPDYQNLPDERSYANLVAANASAHTILGSSDADFIDAGAGNDVIDGGAGNDYLIGGDGNDTYRVGAGAGQDTINNLSNNPASDTDVLQFLAGFDENNLWFSRDGDNLVVDVIGSDEQVTIQDWYTGSGQQLDEIRTDDAVLQADMVDNLVNAMAAFGAPPAGDAQLPQEVRDEIAPVIAANWQAA